MKDIEKYIKDHAALFDVEPEEGHFDRFEAKLKQQKQGRRRHLLHQSMRVAAVGLLLIMSGLYLSSRWKTEADEQALSYQQEFMEARYYYTNQIDQGLTTLEEMQGVLSEEQRAMLIEELTAADTLFNELQVDLKASPNDPRVLKAMLDHYRVKAMIINKIVDDLEQINASQKEKTYENAQI